MKVDELLELPCTRCGGKFDQHKRIEWRDEQDRRCIRYECPDEGADNEGAE